MHNFTFGIMDMVPLVTTKASSGVARQEGWKFIGVNPGRNEKNVDEIVQKHFSGGKLQYEYFSREDTLLFLTVL